MRTGRWPRRAGRWWSPTARSRGPGAEGSGRSREPRAADGGPVGEDELHIPLGCEADGLPHRVGQERVGRSAVDEEANAHFRSGRTADGALDVADAHTPEYGIAAVERRHPKIAARGKPTPEEHRGPGGD